MRIVGGKYRHRIIIYLDDATHTRPTKDRVREAIFSAIGDISNACVLDLYAGSGAMGIEALSRGAASVIFVEGIQNIFIVIHHHRLGCGGSGVDTQEEPAFGCSQISAADLGSVMTGTELIQFLLRSEQRLDQRCISEAALIRPLQPVQHLQGISVVMESAYETSPPGRLEMRVYIYAGED